MTAQARGPTPTSGLQPRPTRRGVSIALVLAVTLSSLVMLAVASVIAINFTIGRENTLELLRERGELAVSAAVSQVRSQLDPAVQQLNYLANVIGSLDEPLEDSSRVADLLNGALAATPQISRIVFTSAQLQLTAAERNESGAKISASDQTTNLLLRRNLAQAEAHHEGWWAELILDPRGSGVTLLNRRHPVWHGATFVGELLAFVSVRELSATLPTVTAGSAVGRSFILYDRDFVLAHPRLLQPITGLTAQHPLPSLVEVDDPVLAAIWDPLVSAPLLGRSAFHIVNVDGVRHLYLYRGLDDYGAKPLIVGAWFRAEDAFDELRRLALATTAGFGILLLGCVAAVWLGRRIARPIRGLARAANQLRHLEFAKTPNLKESRIRELAEQARAFNDMLVGLRWFEAYVPRTLIRHLLRHSSGRKFPSVERNMTVMFTDIVGFTTLAEHRSAADTAAFLNHHFAMVTQAIEAEDGTVDKFIGDGAMAFWNAPHRHHDHPRRAARAALAIAAAIAADNQKRVARGRKPIQMRIGVHTGPVVVGNIGPEKRLNYTIVGDTVNTAQRIEQLCRDVPNGEDVVILIGDRTAAELGDEFDCQPAGRFNVRGRAEFVEVFRLRAKDDTPSARPAVAAGSAAS